MAAVTGASGTERRPSPLGVGVVVWLASELMFFSGLFAAYFTLRASRPPAGRRPASTLDGPHAPSPLSSSSRRAARCTSRRRRASANRTSERSPAG